jgi:chitodextrinase
MRFIKRVLSVFALVVLAASQAAAAQLALTWDPNTEPDIAGYIVEWGVGTSYTNTVDVGKVTTWTLTNAVEGTTYSFRVVAYNTAGERSDPSTAVSGSATAVPPAPAPAPAPTPAPTPPSASAANQRSTPSR